jgi:Caspase domain/PAN domain
MNIRLAIAAMAAMLAVAMSGAGASAQDRVALVVGINNYAKLNPLQKADNDARAVSATLGRLGFRVDLALDVDRRGFDKALSDFLNKIKPGAIVYFHYSGHGVSIDNDTYLIPADMDLPRSEDREFVKREAIRLSELLDSFKNAKASARVIVVDACRENPFAAHGVRSIGAAGGIALLPAPEGTLIMYSAADGQTALDGLGANDKEATSVYTRTLLKHLVTPGLSMVEMAREVRREVEDLAKTVGHDQRPAYYDELSDDLRLTAATSAAAGAQGTAAAGAPTGAAPPGAPAPAATNLAAVSPGAAAGAAPSGRNAVPAAPPQPAQPAQPAPPAKTAALPPAAAPLTGVLAGVNLPGSNYRVFSLAQADPGLCQSACKSDAHCAAWTFIENSQNRCLLKPVVPARLTNACCVSGVERTPDPALSEPPPVAPSLVGAMRGIDLPGLDLRSFIAADNDPTVCQAACKGDNQCAAWTYVKADIVAAQARCVLKRAIPTEVASPCCVSGIEKPGVFGANVVTAPPAGGHLLAGINLPGGDYRNFQLPTAEPALCQSACKSEAQCAAWTYVQPGSSHVPANGPGAERPGLGSCWLKRVATQPHAAQPCCTSGIERP